MKVKSESEVAQLCLWKNTREFQKNIYFCFIDYAKALDCVDHNKLVLHKNWIGVRIRTGS